MGHTVAVATPGALRKKRKARRTEVKEENYDNGEEEYPSRETGRRKC